MTTSTEKFFDLHITGLVSQSHPRSEAQERRCVGCDIAALNPPVRQLDQGRWRSSTAEPPPTDADDRDERDVRNTDVPATSAEPQAATPEPSRPAAEAADEAAADAPH